MGGGASKDHESFDVSPTATAVTDGFDSVALTGTDLLDPQSPPAADPLLDLLLDSGQPVPEMLLPPVDPTTAAIEQALNDIEAAQQKLNEVWFNADASPTERFQALQAYVDEADAILDQAGLDPSDAKPLRKEEVVDLCRERLAGLSPEDLNLIAFAEGFPHPTLVGMSDPSAESPLVFWLNPAYDKHLPQKTKIAAKADERYQLLLAGGQLPGGITLADVQQAEAGFAAPSSGPTPTAVKPPLTVASLSETVEGIAALPANKHWYLATPETTALALAYADTLRNHAPPPGHEAEFAEARAALQSFLNQDLLGHEGKAAGKAFLDAEIQAGNLPDAAYLLPRSDVAALLVGAQSEEIQNRLDLVAPYAATIKENQAKAADWFSLKTQFDDLVTGNLDAADAKQLLVDGIKARAALVECYKAHNAVEGYTGVPFAAESLADGNPVAYASALDAKAFREWAKGQSVKDIRDIAEGLGLPKGSAGKLSKAELQNFVLLNGGCDIYQVKGAWKKYSTKEDYLDAMKQKAAGPKVPKKANSVTVQASTGLAGGTSTQAAAVASAAKLPTTTTTSSGWSQKVAAGAALMKTHAAAHADIPRRASDAEFAQKKFTQSNLPLPGGGSHERWSMIDESGEHWIFKPDKSAQGARGVAEAVASKVISGSGVPNIPVYYHDAGTKKGCIQPVVKGASDLAGTSPQALSQAEVDSVVKGAVSLWMVGDHDAAGSNWLRTPSGGIAPCDQGQAFKFVGEDRLAIDYNPNAGYNGPSLPNQVLSAAKSGGLAPGVKVRPEVAIPVIERFEKMSDTEWRETLRPVAVEGVKSGTVHWVSKMRDVAAKAKSKPVSAVTDHEVVDAFLDTMTARKHNLRKDFRNYLAQANVDTTIFDL